MKLKGGDRLTDSHLGVSLTFTWPPGHFPLLPSQIARTRVVRTLREGGLSSGGGGGRHNGRGSDTAPADPIPRHWLDKGIRLTLVKKIDSGRSLGKSPDDEVLRSNTLDINGP